LRRINRAISKENINYSRKASEIDRVKRPVPDLLCICLKTESTVKVTEKPEEVKALLEVGFEYVCQKDNLIFLRKAK